MSETYRFALALVVVASAGQLALLSNRVTERLKVPAPLLVLVAAAAVAMIPPAGRPN